MKRALLFSTIIVLTLVVLPLFVEAQTYEFLVKDLPFITEAEDEGLPGLLNAFFKFGLAIAVTLSVVMFTYNGVQYMVSEVVGNKSKAVGGMQASIWGLVMAFAAWLVLRTINPALVDFQLFKTIQEVRDRLNTNIEEQTTPGPTATTTPGEMPESERAAREKLKALGIGVNRENHCETATSRNCTNVANMPAAMVSLLSRMTQFGKCPESGPFTNCPITITGGTEMFPHRTHGPGKPVVDLRKNIAVEKWLQAYATKCPAQYDGGDVWIVKNALQQYFWDEQGGDPHWHACMGSTFCGNIGSVCETVHEN